MRKWNERGTCKCERVIYAASEITFEFIYNRPSA